MKQVYENIPFENWGLVEEARNTPALTCVPTKVEGLINLVNWVKKYHPELRIRCAGYRHSWAPIFSEDNQILVSMLNLQQVTQLPDPSVISPTSKENVYNDFKVIEEPVVAADKKSAIVRLGAAITTEEFRRWSTDDGNWCLPLDVILGEYVSLLLLTQVNVLSKPTESLSEVPMAASATVLAMVSKHSTTWYVQSSTSTSTASTKKSPINPSWPRRPAASVS